MFLPGGHAYVYFIYGMYSCFNIVTLDEKAPEAVLIRALEPKEGVAHMQKYRNKSHLKDLTTGPGKLCQALAIDRSLNEQPLTGADIFVEKGHPVEEAQIHSTDRVGIDYAGDAVHWPLRFYLKDNPYVSRR